MHIYDIVIAVSQEHLLEHNNLKFIRTCNAMSRFIDALIIPAIIGIQGKAYLFLNNKVITLVSVALLLLRAYAVTDHKRLVLSVLGILSVCAIGPELVCTRVISMTGICDQHLSQTDMVLDRCELTSSQLHTFQM